MAATQTQLRRGTSAQCDAMIPAEAEVVVDLTNDRLRLGDGATGGGIHIPNANDIRSEVFSYVNAGGTGNAITLTFSPPLLAYGNGLKLSFKASANNTGAASLNVNGLGAVNIQKTDGLSLVALEANDIRSGQIYELRHNGTTFQLLNPSVPPSSGALILLSTVSASGASVTFTSGFSSTYDDYALHVRGLTHSGATTSASLQYTTDSGGGWTTYATLSGSPGFLTPVTGKTELFGANGTSPKAATYFLTGSQSAATALAARIASGATINGLRLNLNIGTYISGTASLYGYVK